MAKQGKSDGSYGIAPIIFKELGGTIYGVYGYFSPEATETAIQKTRRLILKEANKVSKTDGFY